MEIRRQRETENPEIENGKGQEAQSSPRSEESSGKPDRKKKSGYLKLKFKVFLRTFGMMVLAFLVWACGRLDCIVFTECFSFGLL